MIYSNLINILFILFSIFYILFWIVSNKYKKIIAIIIVIIIIPLLILYNIEIEQNSNKSILNDKINILNNYTPGNLRLNNN